MAQIPQTGQYESMQKGFETLQKYSLKVYAV